METALSLKKPWYKMIMVRTTGNFIVFSIGPLTGLMRFLFTIGDSRILRITLSRDFFLYNHLANRIGHLRRHHTDTVFLVGM